MVLFITNTWSGFRRLLVWPIKETCTNLLKIYFRFHGVICEGLLSACIQRDSWECLPQKTWHRCICFNMSSFTSSFEGWQLALPSPVSLVDVSPFLMSRNYVQQISFVIVSWSQSEDWIDTSLMCHSLKGNLFHLSLRISEGLRYLQNVY